MAGRPARQLGRPCDRLAKTARHACTARGVDPHRKKSYQRRTSGNAANLHSCVARTIGRGRTSTRRHPGDGGQIERRLGGLRETLSQPGVRSMSQFLPVRTAARPRVSGPVASPPLMNISTPRKHLFRRVSPMRRPRAWLLLLRARAPHRVRGSLAHRCGCTTSRPRRGGGSAERRGKEARARRAAGARTDPDPIQWTHVPMRPAYPSRAPIRTQWGSHSQQ